MAGLHFTASFLKQIGRDLCRALIPYCEIVTDLPLAIQETEEEREEQKEGKQGKEGMEKKKTEEGKKNSENKGVKAKTKVPNVKKN